MNKMEKNSLYDELCRTLTEYEEQREPIKGVEWSCKDELYFMLIKIQNKWEELTGEEE